MDGTDAEVIERMREQAGAFEHQSDKKDDRVNDGNNYKGLMNAADYKKRRVEVLEDPEEKKREQVLSALAKDRDARVQEVRDREAREAQRREKLQRELAGAEGEQAGEAEAAEVSSSSGPKKKKKKKKDADQGGLSFDVDE